MIPFGLKTAAATYQHLVNNMFSKQIGKTMELNVDDMLVKSMAAKDYEQYLAEIFRILKKYNMKLNSLRCAFEVGKFLSYMVKGDWSKSRKHTSHHWDESTFLP